MAAELTHAERVRADRGRELVVKEEDTPLPRPLQGGLLSTRDQQRVLVAPGNVRRAGVGEPVPRPPPRCPPSRPPLHHATCWEEHGERLPSYKRISAEGA